MNTTPLESKECETFKNYLEVKKLKFTHIVNEGNFPVQYRMKLKRMGFSRGIPDYMVLLPNGIAFVEIKRLKGSHTYPEQVEWIEALNRIPGVEAKICYGSQEAIDFIEDLTTI